MKILAVSELDLDVRDGSTTHFLELLTHLSKSNDVKALVPRTGKSSVKSGLNIEHVRAFTPKYADRSAKLFYIAKIIFFISYQFFLFFKILNISKKEKVEVIYSRQGMLSVSVILSSKILKRPLVTELNGILSDELKIVGVPLAFIKTLTFFEGLSLRNSSAIIAVTEPIKRAIRDEYDLRIPIFVTSNGANVDLFRPMESKAAREELSLDVDRHYITFVGYLTKWQGLEQLIEVAPIILERFGDTKFLIVGEGEWKKKLEEDVKSKGLEKSWMFVGNVPYDKVPLYINASDVFVIPKTPMRSDFSPLKLYEALSCGKPVIVTKTEGMKFVEDMKVGFCVDPFNVNEMSQAMFALLENAELAEGMGKKGRELILKNFSWEKIARNVEDILKSAATT